MRSFLAVLSALVVAEGCRVPCHWNDPKPLVNYYDALASKVIALDQMLNNHCRANNVPDDVKYCHTDDKFEIEIPIAGFQPSNFMIKAGRRLLFIEAFNCDEDLKYSDIRFIPDYLSLNRGRWSYVEDLLTISIPYSSGSLHGVHHLYFDNRNLQNGLIVLRKDECCTSSRGSSRRSRRYLQSSNDNVENNTVLDSVQHET